MDGINCFSRTLLQGEEEEWEANLEECRVRIAQQSSNELWALLGNDVESFRDRLVLWMGESGQNRERAWLAAKTFCDMAQLAGSEAYRACDRKSMQSLLAMMKRTLNAVSGNGEGNDGKKKRRKTVFSEEEKDDWNLFFMTLARLSDSVDVEEMADVFINIGLSLGSSEVLTWIVSVAHEDKKRISLLRTLLTVTIQAYSLNDLTKERNVWISSALNGLTKGKEDSFLAFIQRLPDRTEPSTQVNRTRLVELIQLSILPHTLQLKSDYLRFCTLRLMVSDRSFKRTLACEIAASIASTLQDNIESEVLHSFALRSRDTVPAVRCAALRSMMTLASKKPFILQENNECLLKAAIRASQMDDKPGVRRWAVKVLSACPSYEAEIINVCIDRCRDVSIVVKKSALEALGNFIMRYPFSAGEAFRTGVLPLVRDSERGVSETALNIIREMLLTNTDFNMIWSLLYLISAEWEVECFGQALREIAARPDSASSLKQFVSAIAAEAMITLPNENEANQKALWGIWLILEKSSEVEGLLPGPKSFPGSFICEAWTSICGLLTLSCDDEKVGAFEAHALQRRCLTLMCVLADRIEQGSRVKLGNDILSDLAALDRPPEVISEMLKVLHVFCITEENAGGAMSAREMIQTLGNSLKSCCETALSSFVDQYSEESQVAGSIFTADCALFLVGELAMLGFNPDRNEDKLIPFSADEEITLLVQAFTTPDTVGSRGKRNVVTRSFAFLALGKLCIRDDTLAKQCITVFVKELSENFGPGHEAVRCNALLTLCDLCRRFTNLVEPYIDRISKSLGDPSPVVRKRCLLALSGLIQEEYVRLRPTLFFRFLACAGDDEDDSVAQAGEYVLLSGFLTKNPTLFHSNASNMIFALGGLTRYNFRTSDGEAASSLEDVSCLVGMQSRFMRKEANRERLHKLVFSKLDDAQKFEICNKIRRDVFGGLLDGTIALEQFDMNAEELSPVTMVTMDAFKILESDYSKQSLGANKTGNITEDGEEASQDAMTSTETAVQRATAKIIDALDRKNMVDNVVPMMVSLYYVSSRERSSLTKLIIDHLRYLHGKYPEEVTTALAPHRDIHGVLQLDRRKSETIAIKEVVNEVLMEDIENRSNIALDMKEDKVAKTPKLLRRVRASMMRG